MNKMHDFVLKVMPGDTGYLIHVECSSVGEAGPQPVKKSILTSLARYSYSTAISVGQNLYRAIIRDEIHELFERALAVAESQSAGLRLLLKFSQSPELHEVPWELLHNGQEFLAINPKTPIVRYLEQARKVDSLEVKPPIRILFTTACPQGQVPLDLAAEERYIRLALGHLGEKIDLVVERNISIRQLRHALMRAQNRENRPFHIWHHCGHGSILNGKFVLALEEHGKRALADVSQLSALVKACPDLRVVTLNVCHGSSAVGLAPALATLNVPAVIGFRGSILDQSALTFAEAFYEAIFHTPLDVALGQARMALAVQNNQTLDWSLPLLFLRTTNSLILKQQEDTKPEAVLPNDTKSSLPSHIKIGGTWEAGKATVIGVIGGQAPGSQVEIAPDVKVKGELTQIGELRNSELAEKILGQSDTEENVTD